MEYKVYQIAAADSHDGHDHGAHGRVVRADAFKYGRSVVDGVAGDVHGAAGGVENIDLVSALFCCLHQPLVRVEVRVRREHGLHEDWKQSQQFIFSHRDGSPWTSKYMSCAMGIPS